MAQTVALLKTQYELISRAAPEGRKVDVDTGPATRREMKPHEAGEGTGLEQRSLRADFGIKFSDTTRIYWVVGVLETPYYDFDLRVLALHVSISRGSRKADFFTQRRGAETTLGRRGEAF